MQAYELSELIEKRAIAESLYLEFLRVPSMSMGVYQLAAGADDLQSPHTEDEVYYVTGGRGMIRVGEEDRAVQAGSIVFVAANVPHKFHSITEDLTLLVFFAPAEYANRTVES